MSENPESTYTLEEARQILAEQECAREGHCLEQTVIHERGSEYAVRIDVYCGNCGVRFEQVPK